MFEALPFSSQRSPVLAKNIVATSQPLASSSGLEMLRLGGNAIDAAIASAACLTVMEPTGNGLGSDAFAQVWDGKTLHAFNGSGRSPAGIDYTVYHGQKRMPKWGWPSVTVPGCVALWADLHKQFGQLPFEQCLRPAIEYARHGFLVSPLIARAWSASLKHLSCFDEWMRCFCPQGRAPKQGEQYHNANQAQTLQRIAESYGEDFYTGTIARSIISAAQAAGFDWQGTDLSQHKTEQVKPVLLDYGSWQLSEIPPNGQGIAAQIALAILRHFPIAEWGVDDAKSMHVQWEAMKYAFADAFRFVADSAALELTPSDLLAEERIQRHVDSISLDRASYPVSEPLVDQGTVYLSTADANGMMVSFIQSNFHGFGSGIVIPDTGISMQNRGLGFSCTPGHPNCVAAGKKPFHTIIPGFILKDAEALCSFGVMGGHMQAQAHVQMMLRLHDQGLNPQAALDAPRWMIAEDNKSVVVDAGFEQSLIASLSELGHQIRIEQNPGHGGQAIYRLADGYIAGSDKRKDGCAVGF